MKIILSKSQFENLDLEIPRYAYQYLLAHKFEKSKMTPNIINTLAQSPRASWNTARHLNWENIPDALINSISRIQYLSYLWAKHVGFNESKIPPVIKRSILDGSDDRWKYYYDRALLYKSRKGKDDKPKELIMEPELDGEESLDKDLFTITKGTKMKVKLSKAQWEQVGKTAGWLKKKAGGWGRFSEDLSDVLEAQVMMAIQKHFNADEIFIRIKQFLSEIKGNDGLAQEILSEGITDEELKEFIDDHIRMMSIVNR